MKNKKCKICQESSGKRNVCKNCKEKYPFRSAGKNGIPFDRKKEYEKDRKKTK